MRNNYRAAQCAYILERFLVKTHKRKGNSSRYPWKGNLERRILGKIREKSDEWRDKSDRFAKCRRETQYRIGVRVTFAERGRG